MNEIVSNLLVYGSLPEDSILWQLADICEKLKDGTETKAALRGRVFHQVKNLLTVATDYAFDKNLWHNYLTFLLITNENPFSLVCEKMGAQEGTVNNFVTHDFDMFKELFDYDFFLAGERTLHRLLHTADPLPGNPQKRADVQ